MYTKRRKIKKLPKSIIAFLSGGGLSTFLYQLFENKKLLQIGEFVNSWPFTISVIMVCITVLFSILILEVFKTKRDNNRNKELNKENTRLGKKIQALKDKMDRIIEYNYKLRIQIVQKEEELYYLEQIIRKLRK